MIPTEVRSNLQVEATAPAQDARTKHRINRNKSPMNHLQLGFMTSEPTTRNAALRDRCQTLKQNVQLPRGIAPKPLERLIEKLQVNFFDDPASDLAVSMREVEEKSRAVLAI